MGGQARGQIVLLAAIVAAIMSIVRWLKNKESSPLLPVEAASTSAAIEEIEKTDAQHHRKKRGTYHHCDDEIQVKFAKY